MDIVDQQLTSDESADSSRSLYKDEPKLDKEPNLIHYSTYKQEFSLGDSPPEWCHPDA